MLTLRFLWVGKTDDREYARGVERYVARIRSWARVEERVIRPDRERGAEAAEREGRRILEALEGRQRVVVLEEGGKMRTSAELARMLSDHGERDPRPLTVVVGGASGLSSEVRDRADERLSLSPMTFPHQIARLLLVEQVYRALSIRAGLRYH